MCGAEVETLEHFLIECVRLQGVRSRYGGVEGLGGVLGFGVGGRGWIGAEV